MSTFFSFIAFTVILLNGVLSDEESEGKESEDKDDAMDVDGEPNTQPKNDPDDLSAYKLDEYDDDTHSSSMYILLCICFTR